MKQILSLLERKKRFRLKVEGNSMFPTLHSSDVLELVKASFMKLKVNDIILIHNKQSSYIHQIIYKSKRKNWLITKGTNNLNADPIVKKKLYAFKVTQVYRKGHYINKKLIFLTQSTMYFQEITKICDLLLKNQINYVILKGLPLNLFIEKKHPERIFADCDILVRVTQLEKVHKILLSNGFINRDTSYSLVHKLLKDKITELTYVKIVNGLSVIFDVHVEPVFIMNQIGSLDVFYTQKLIDKMTEEFIRNKRIITIYGYKINILNTSNLILYLSLHFFHHNYRGINRLQFIDIVIRKGKISDNAFDNLTRSIDDYKVKNFVSPVFVLLRKYFDTPLPIKFLNFIKDVPPPTRSIQKQLVSNNVFNDQRSLEAGINRFYNLYHLSPRHLLVKNLIVFYPAVYINLLWVLFRYITLFVRSRFLRLISLLIHQSLWRQVF